MTRDDIIKLALEALSDFDYDKRMNAIAAIREALAQPEQEPEQEPVAVVTSETGAPITMSWWHEPALPVGTKLYTTPSRREWQGLTHDEIRAAYRAVSEIEWALGGMGDATPFARAIEAKLREKNA